MRFLWVSLGSILLSAQWARAQSYSLTSYGLKDGLPTLLTKSITQDYKGLLWVATDLGVATFDGEKFISVKELPFTYMKHVYCNGDQTLSIISDVGVYQIELNGDDFLSKQIFKSSTKNLHNTLNYPKRIIEDSRSRKWFIEFGGVALQKNDSLIHFLVPEEFITQNYTNPYFFFENKKDEYLLFNQTLSVFKIDVFSESLEPIHLQKNSNFFATQIIQVREGEYLIAGNLGLKSAFYTNNRIRFSEYYLEGYISVVGKKKDGCLVVIYRDGRVFMSKNGEVKQLKQVPDVMIPASNSMYEDIDGNLWITSDYGIFLLEETIFSHIKVDVEFPFVQCVAEKNGAIYTSIDNGIYKINVEENGAVQTTKIQNLTGIVLSIAGDADRLILGHLDGHISIITKTYNKRVQLPLPQHSSLSQPPSVFNMFEDSKGRIWLAAGSVNGVYQLNKNNELQLYDSDDGIKSAPLDFAQDKNGLLYVSALSDSSYLYRYDEINDRFDQLSEKIDFYVDDLGVFAVHQIDVDVFGTIWMATNYGIFTFSNKGLKKQPGFEQFPTHLIRSIAVANNGDVWLGAENGLFSYKDGSLLEFELSDGLPSMTINYRSSLIDKQGRLWVGTNNGLAYQFSSTDEKRQTPAPFIKSIRVGSDLTYIRPNFIDAFDSRKAIAIEYHSYIFPQNKIRYQYNINKTGWSEFTQSTILNLSNLEPNSYSIQLRAVKRGHAISNSNTITFTVSPVWYFAWYMQVLYVGIFALLGLLFVRYRISVKEQKRTSRLLNQTEQRLQLLLNNAPVLLFSLDKNLNFLIFAGKAADEFIEENGIKPRHVNQLFTGFSELPELKEVFLGNTQVLTLQVKDKVFDSRLTPIMNKQGQLVEIIGISLDITNRILAEKELLEAKNIAEKANIAKSVFLANMSHELRTPLNAILGFASLLVKQQTTEEQQKKYLNTIYSSGEHLLLMINEILDLSKIESGKMEISLESTDVTSMMSELESMFQIQAVRKNLVFELLIDSNVPQYILTDSRKLRQILINLIGNAIKYTDKGLVSISVHCDKITKRLLFDVKDTGTGIPEEMQAMIFQPFKQVQSNYSDGTGLGLSIAKGIADLLGGQISVKSELGKGSVFTLEIPLMEISNKEAEPLLEHSFDEVRNFKVASGCSALVVDDKQENRELMSDYLKHFGFETTLATNGKEAVDAVEKQDFTIIMMDIYMPVLDGKKAFEAIRKMKPYIPVVAVTAGGFEEFKSELEALGFDGFLHKPFKDIQLVNLLKRLVPASVDTIKISGESASVLSDESRQIQHLKHQIEQLSENLKEELVDAIDLMDFDELMRLSEQLEDEVEYKQVLVEKARSHDYKFFLQLSELFQVD